MEIHREMTIFFFNCSKFLSFQDDWSIIIKLFPYLTCCDLHKIMEVLASTQRKKGKMSNFIFLKYCPIALSKPTN